MHSTVFMTYLLALCSPALAQQSSAGDSGNCTVFNWDHQRPTLGRLPPQRVSGAQTCETKGNGTCALTAAGDAQFEATKNITTLQGHTYADLVQEAVSKDSDMPAPSFNQSVIGAIDQTRSLHNGHRQLLLLRHAGQLYGAVRNGTAVEFCAPVWHDDGVVSGEYSIVRIDKDDVDQYSDPYENQSSGEDESGSDKGESGPDGAQRRSRRWRRWSWARC
ncbi:hypothetical protein P168DRAFT_326425 [Aspergillus campestris IBT 28561]|uniref:Uncharacterized protein n=1 Tax=Aspergillus campestris (strain IBT 28561) TaxID=1392248 RepID=A0A2I1D405_ASPC2|nr:uncharacterized protein P168DRAFT_326425 [Aspergillus campestris IBT 28561]PKY04599.1 hypothetical protein P168DRAFT_326425 [Aspergillus campestris IBT 28561]